MLFHHLLFLFVFSNVYAFEITGLSKSPSPILTPSVDPQPFDSFGIYNPTAALVDSDVILYFRGVSKSSQITGVIGVATSQQGPLGPFDVHAEPILVPDETYDIQGCEDPRLLTWLPSSSSSHQEDDVVVALTYVCNDGHYNSSHICLAQSKDGHSLSPSSWVKFGKLLNGSWSSPGDWDYGNRKAAQIVEVEKGRFVMFYLGESRPWHTCIGLATSTDLFTWQPYQHNPVICPRENHFDSLGVEPGTAFVMGDQIVLLYNGWNDEKRHCTGMAVLDKKDGSVVSRANEPLIQPTLSWEVSGVTSNVTFTEGSVILRDRIALFYGAADRDIGVAIGKWTKNG